MLEKEREPLMSVANQPRTELPTQAWAQLQQTMNRFEVAWQRGEGPNIEEYLPSDSSRPRFLIELIHADLEYRLKAGDPARLEEYCKRFPELVENREAMLELIAAEYELRRSREPQIQAEEYLRRFASYREELAHRMEIASIQEVNEGRAVQSISAGPLRDVSRSALQPTPISTAEDTRTLRADVPPQPKSIGRYRIDRLLGRGGFGLVYLGYDEQLSRPVAIKVPHAHLVTQPARRRKLSHRGPHGCQPRPFKYRAGLRCGLDRALPLFHRLQVH
jgi:hypothetical protein